MPKLTKISQSLIISDTNIVQSEANPPNHIDVSKTIFQKLKKDLMNYLMTKKFGDSEIEVVNRKNVNEM
jgi:hypothetical protein